MRLNIFEYVSDKDLSGQWQIGECQFNQTNLIVGRNATGKSKIVRAIHILSELLKRSEYISYLPKKHEWHLFFDIDIPEQKTEYILKINGGIIVQEQLIIYSRSDKPILNRHMSGRGTIYAEELRQNIQFQIDQKELAAVKHRDSIQHPFLNDLYQWAKSLRFYDFGTATGKYPGSTIGLFVRGKKEIGDRFIQAVISDMAKIGYLGLKLETKEQSFIGSVIPTAEHLKSVFPFLYIKEYDLNCEIEFSTISQGMAQALSLFIQINYSLLANKPNCIVIDNIGQGLDYRRSLAIMRILMEKISTGSIQFIMATNNQFIMNVVPLEHWLFIERTPDGETIHNLCNKKERIEEVRFIGVNNYDLFVADILP
jgi:AAA15 family ATPase/GTPase